MRLSLHVQEFFRFMRIANDPDPDQGSPDHLPTRSGGLLSRLSLSWLPPLRSLASRAGGLLPGACALCAATGPHVLCAGCRAQYFRPASALLPDAAATRCRCCALPIASAGAGASVAAPTCGACLHTPPAFDATAVAADYAAPVDQLVLGLKFGRNLALAPLFADLLRDAMLCAPRAGLALPECLTAVPLGPDRLRERGFNQALEIARPLAAALGVPLAPRLLVRVRNTVAQARLSPDERRVNLRGAFTLDSRMLAAVRGRHVGVVDDVMTTGETLGEIARVLKRFGATRVTCLAFARTLPA